MLKFIRILGLAGLAGAGACIGGGKVMDIKWDELAALPPSPEQPRQAGLAGPFAGAHANVLFVGGGANFPDKAPWEGGTKAWWDDLFVLERRADGKTQWVTDKHFKLPRPIAYGMSFTTPDGVICAGGCDATQCYRDVFLLAWDSVGRAVTTTSLPSLPAPLAFMAGAMIGHTIYVAGGQQTMKDAVPSSVFWSLDLSRRARPEEFKWETLPAWPGPARIVPVAAGSAGKFFLFSGRAFHAGRPAEIFTDAYAFDPATHAWQTVTPINGHRDGNANGTTLSVMAGTAVTAADDEILLFSGDRGDLFLKLEAYDLEVEAMRQKLPTALVTERASLQHEIDARLLAKKKIYDTHPGFGREVLAYDTRRDAWRIVTRSPVPGQVTTIAVPWGDAIVIPNGEVRPGIRTADVTRLRLISQ